MIIDKLDNWGHYPFGTAWERAYVFLKSLTPEADEKKYDLQGDDMFARVMSYETQAPEIAILESHRKYIDIQMVLVGGEGIEWFLKDGLVVDKPYDETKDAELYKRISPGLARVDVLPGTFVMLFPHDAHMPALMIEKKSELIKKVVVKIRLELLLTQLGQSPAS